MSLSLLSERDDARRRRRRRRRRIRTADVEEIAAGNTCAAGRNDLKNED